MKHESKTERVATGKKAVTGSGARILAGVLAAATACAGLAAPTAAMATEYSNSTIMGSQKILTIRTNNDTSGTSGLVNQSVEDDNFNTAVYVDANGDGTATATTAKTTDKIDGTWYVDIPATMLLSPASGTTKNKPGAYEGSATVSVGGELGSAQKLTVVPVLCELSDSANGSDDIVTYADSSSYGTVTSGSSGTWSGGLDSLTATQVAAKPSATFTTTANITPGAWSGYVKYRIKLVTPWSN